MAKLLAEEPRLMLLIESRPRLIPLGPYRQKVILFWKEVGANLRRPETKRAAAEAGIFGSLTGVSGALISNALMPPISERLSRFYERR